MKNENVMPDWVLKYKKKGYSIRKKGNSYILFKVSSKRVEGKNYPVTTSKYIGVIKETGLIQSKALTLQEVKQLKNEQITYIEYGYTNLIYKLCYRELVRSVYGYTVKYSNPLIFLAIIKYVMGSDSLVAISSTYLGVSHYEEIIAVSKNESNMRRIKALTNKIENYMSSTFSKEELDTLSILLKLVVIKQGTTDIQVKYSDKVIEILKEHKIDL